MGQAILPVLGGYAAISQGEQARKAQKEAAQQQRETEAKAEAAAASQDRANMENQAKMNRRKADPFALLAAAARESKQGAASTVSNQPGSMLGGPLYARSTLLGR
jgi:ATPase subunit of ABC transporter with duplicated ATPase domains